VVYRRGSIADGTEQCELSGLTRILLSDQPMLRTSETVLSVSGCWGADLIEGLVASDKAAYRM
jgi:hypothetical protein